MSRCQKDGASMHRKQTFPHPKQHKKLVLLGDGLKLRLLLWKLLNLVRALRWINQSHGLPGKSLGQIHHYDDLPSVHSRQPVPENKIFQRFQFYSNSKPKLLGEYFPLCQIPDHCVHTFQSLGSRSFCRVESNLYNLEGESGSLYWYWRQQRRNVL